VTYNDFVHLVVVVGACTANVIGTTEE